VEQRPDSDAALKMVAKRKEAIYHDLMGLKKELREEEGGHVEKGSFFC